MYEIFCPDGSLNPQWGEGAWLPHFLDWDTWLLHFFDHPVLSSRLPNCFIRTAYSKKLLTPGAGLIGADMPFLDPFENCSSTPDPQLYDDVSSTPTIVTIIMMMMMFITSHPQRARGRKVKRTTDQSKRSREERKRQTNSDNKTSTSSRCK